MKKKRVLNYQSKNILLSRRQVSYEEGENFAKENGLMFLEVSAKTAHNVEEAFTSSARQILNSVSNTESDIGNVSISLF